uniref:Uncharacterized protein n=1 Tax=Phlebotomus papatasi TaxID=29031 RepID=A0A1B0CYM7_PHLPP
MEKAGKESKKRFDFKLIKLVKEYPALYNKYHEDFHNKLKKDWLWQSIGQKCGKSGERCRARFQNLRSDFVKRYRKRQSSSNADNNTGSTKWLFYNDLLFLADHLWPMKKLRSSGEIKKNDTANIPMKDEPEDVNPDGEDFSELNGNCDTQEDPIRMSPVQLDFEESLDANETSRILMVENPGGTESSGVDKVLQSMSQLIDTLQKTVQCKEVSPHKPFLDLIEKQLLNVPPDKLFDFQLEILGHINKMIKEYRKK